MSVSHETQKRLERERQHIVSYLSEHPGSTPKEIAFVMLKKDVYKPVSAKDLERSAVKWCKRHLSALCNKGDLIEANTTRFYLQNPPMISFENARQFISKTPGSGLWRNGCEWFVVHDATNGWSMVGLVTPQDAHRLREEKVVGPNTYGGFKNVSIYDRAADTDWVEHYPGYDPRSPFYQPTVEDALRARG